MQDQGGGGLSVVSFSISEMLIALVILGVVLFGLWRVAKLLWSALSG